MTKFILLPLITGILDYCLLGKYLHFPPKSELNTSLPESLHYLFVLSGVLQLPKKNIR